MTGFGSAPTESTAPNGIDAASAASEANAATAVTTGSANSAAMISGWTSSTQHRDRLRAARGERGAPVAAETVPPMRVPDRRPGDQREDQAPARVAARELEQVLGRAPAGERLEVRERRRLSSRAAVGSRPAAAAAGAGRARGRRSRPSDAGGPGRTRPVPCRGPRTATTGSPTVPRRRWSSTRRRRSTPTRRSSPSASASGAAPAGRVGRAGAVGGRAASRVGSASSSAPAARRARARYSGPCLRGSAYSRGLIVQYVPEFGSVPGAALPAGSSGVSAASS